MGDADRGCSVIFHTPHSIFTTQTQLFEYLLYEDAQKTIASPSHRATVLTDTIDCRT